MKPLVLAFIAGIAFNLVRGDVAIWNAGVDWIRVALSSVFVVLFLCVAFRLASTRVIYERLMPAAIAGFLLVGLLTSPHSAGGWILNITAILLCLWWARPAKRVYP